MSRPLEAVLARHRTIAIAALFLLIVLAWAWVVFGAGMGMAPLVSLAPPGLGADSMAGMIIGGEWTASYFGLVFAMWWIMMVAMMLPSAAPTILLFARAATGSVPAVPPSTGSFLAGYLIAWGAFSFVATSIHYWLESSGFLDPMSMGLHTRWLAGGVLLAAGAYQLSPLKEACLRQCRNPAQFISRYYRPGGRGALRMGLIHGTTCVGCCWLLMALLFVGGAMNLAWIAVLAIMVAAEKLLPFGRWTSIATGLGCIAWGAAILLP